MAGSPCLMKRTLKMNTKTKKHRRHPKNKTAGSSSPLLSLCSRLLMRQIGEFKRRCCCYARTVLVVVQVQDKNATTNHHIQEDDQLVLQKCGNGRHVFVHIVRQLCMQHVQCHNI